MGLQEASNSVIVCVVLSFRVIAIIFVVIETFSLEPSSLSSAQKSVYATKGFIWFRALVAKPTLARLVDLY